MLSVGYEILTLLRGRVLRYTFKCYVYHSMEIIKNLSSFNCNLIRRIVGPQQDARNKVIMRVIVLQLVAIIYLRKKERKNAL